MFSVCSADTNYIGSKSLEYNLSLIPKGYDLQIWKLKKEDQDYIFSGIKHVLSEGHRNKIVGILNYDEKAKKYTIEIPENVTPKEAPFMMSLLLKKGIRTMNSDWSMRWVQSRIIPSSRQNIGEILRVNGMRSYDEHKLLLKNEGRSCQDEFYIEHM